MKRFGRIRLIWGSEGGERILAGWTSRRENRARLKQTILPEGIVLTQMGRRKGSFSAGELEVTGELRYFLAGDAPKLRFFAADVK